MLNPKSSADPNHVFFDAGMQFGFFSSSLSPHGEWIVVESGVRVWRPYHISHQWRPYLFGRWIWTDDYGWYWMSNEPFGWITYHYGRWYNDDSYGWVWMPGDTWAPAWVEWRYDDNYIGWAPLSPNAIFQKTFGIRFTTHWTAPANYWNVIRYNRFGTILRYQDTAPEEYARHLIHTGRIGLQYGNDHERIINRGIDRAIIEHRGNVRFASIEVREIREQSGERIIRSDDNQHLERIEVYRPSQVEMQRNSEHIEVRRGERNLSIDLNKIEQPRRGLSDDRITTNESRTAEPQRKSGLLREIRQEKQSRGHAPQVREQRSKRDRQEMRHDLIQRHERQQNPAPPALHRPQQQRVERKRESSRITQPIRPTHEREVEKRSDR